MMMKERKRLKRNLVFIFCVFSGLCMSVGAKAQEQPVVTYKADYPREIHAGDSVKLVVTLDIKPGFYIYAPTEINSSQGMQVTQLRFAQQLPAGLQRAGGLQFPKPKQKGAYQVFTGEGIKFVQAFVASKDMQASEIALKGKLVSQACNDHICYPPVTEPFEAIITILK